MSYTLFNKDIHMERGRIVLELSECNYPANYVRGLTIFWQKPKCPKECQGILAIDWGINFSPWIKFSFPIDVLQTCVEDAFFAYSVGNAWKIEDGLSQIKKIITLKREKHGFKVSSKVIDYLQERINSYNAFEK